MLETQLITSDDNSLENQRRFSDDAHSTVTSPPVVTVSPPKEKFNPDEDVTRSCTANAPLLKETEKSDLHNPNHDDRRQNSNDDLNTSNCLLSADCNENTKLSKDNLTVNFSSSGCLRRRDDPSHSRDLLSSPTASRVTFGFGSLDIIMENEKPTEKSTKHTEDDPFERPEKWGWAVVVASWIVMIPIAGVLVSFGTLVSSLTEEFNATKLEAGWIGSLAFSFTVGACPFSTPLFAVYGARKIALVGVFGVTISLFITSFTPTIHLMFLTYSAMFGTFANFVYNTAMNLTGQYFPYKHQALATCLASAGISFGTLLVNPLSQTLVGMVGWRHTLKILAGVMFVVGLACVAVFRPVKTRDQKIHTKIRHHKGKKGHEKETVSDALKHTKISSSEQIDVEELTESNFPTESKMSLAAQEIKKTVLSKNVFDCSFCGNPAFILWMLGTFLWSVSFLFPFIFLIDYMSTIGISRERSAWVMTAYGIAEFGGRLLCALAAGKIPFSLAYVYAGSSVFVGAATLLAPLGKSLGVMYAYAIVAGINSGILNSLMFVATMQFFGNERGRHVWGYINVMLALGMVVGPVAAGGIYDASKSYVTAFYMGGGVFVLCAFVMMLIPIALNYFRQSEPEAPVIREKRSSNGKSSVGDTNKPIVKPGALRKLAQQQASLRAMGKSSKKSKWNGEIQTHLQELDELEEELLKEQDNKESKTVPSTLSQNDDKEQIV